MAAYLVFFHHSTPHPASISASLESLLKEGHIGVSLFFVLSGFLIAYKYAGSADIRDPAFWIRFLGRRFARIYPLYLSLLAVTFWIQPPAEPLEAFLNLTLLKGHFRDYYFSGIAQAWSLTVEETFYVLAPFLFYAASRAGFVTLQLSLYAAAGALMFAGSFHGFYGDLRFTALYTFFGRSFEFLAGMALAHWVHSRERSFAKHSLRLLTYAGVLGCLLVLVALAALRPGYKVGLFHPLGILLNNIALPLAVCAILAGLVSGPTIVSRALSSRPALLLGRSSYAFYLVHIGVISTAIQAHIPNDIWRSFRLFAVMNAVAIAFYILVERPSHRWLSGWLAAADRRRIAAATLRRHERAA